MVSRIVLNTISYHGHGALQNAPEGCEGMARDTSVEEIKELCRSLF